MELYLQLDLIQHSFTMTNNTNYYPILAIKTINLEPYNRGTIVFNSLNILNTVTSSNASVVAAIYNTDPGLISWNYWDADFTSLSNRWSISACPPVATS